MTGHEYPKEVYAILHNKTKKMYIGVSKNPKTRYLHHISQLRRGKHIVGDFQRDFDKYGEDFTFYVFDRIESADQRDKEIMWFERYKTYDRRYGYNYQDPMIVKRMVRGTIPFQEGFPPEVAK